MVKHRKGINSRSSKGKGRPSTDKVVIRIQEDIPVLSFSNLKTTLGLIKIKIHISCWRFWYLRKALKKAKEYKISLTWNTLESERNNLFNSLWTRKFEHFLQVAMIVTSVKERNIGSRDWNRPISDEQGLRLLSFNPPFYHRHEKIEKVKTLSA